MEKELTTIKKKVLADESTKVVDVISAVYSIIHKHDNHDPQMGTGGCNICDCQQFMPSTGTGDNPTCINQNSAGGTCNHYKSEHR